MFRFATYSKLGIHNLVLVGKDAREYRLASGSYEEVSYYFLHLGAIGFYFQFSDKYHQVAHAFFCKLEGVSELWSKLCPVRALIQLARNGLLRDTLFPKAALSNATLSDYMHFVAPIRGLVAGAKFTPHSLRIGGHTFFSIKNMNDDFLHFLGRRAISRVCQLYYRANAYDNIVRLNMFFESISNLHILTR